MIDSHCHLFYEDIFCDLDAKLRQAYEAGVEYLLTVCTNSKVMQQNIDIANANKNVFCSIGIHPMEFHGGYDLDEMKNLAALNRKVVGIGEVGLDFHFDSVERKYQWALFDDMLNLAKETKLPVILHCRKCFCDELFALLNKYKLPAVFHCFSDSLENAKRVIREGYMISITGIVTFKNCGELKEVAKFVPEDMLLIETDAPYLTPVPYRGQPNEPAFVRLVADCVAEVRGVSVEYLGEVTDRNFFRLFERAVM